MYPNIPNTSVFRAHLNYVGVCISEHEMTCLSCVHMCAYMYMHGDMLIHAWGNGYTCTDMDNCGHRVCIMHVCYVCTWAQVYVLTLPTV